jgi:hypothetical protein
MLRQSVDHQAPDQSSRETVDAVEARKSEWIYTTHAVNGHLKLPIITKKHLEKIIDLLTIKYHINSFHNVCID